MHRAFKNVFKKFLPAVALLLVGAQVAVTQSVDVDSPTPLHSNEASAKIVPRDLGDARLTRHFYTFRATEGDLFFTVESTYLFGSVDIFTAQTLRPLAKVTLYGTSSPTTVRRSVYIRREETLILRIEGRTMTDVNALYRVRFEGAFAPSLAAAPTPAEPEPTPQTVARRRGQRVTATGARIEEPVEETASAQRDAPRDTPAENEPVEEATPTPTPRPSATGRRTGASPRSTSRGTRAPGSRTSRAGTNEETADADRSDNAGARESSRGGATSRPPRSTTRTPSKRGTAGTTPGRESEVASARDPHASDRSERENTTSDAEPDAGSQVAGPRLVIVAKNGETFERDMSTVRRVTVERGQIVVTGTDGRITRYPLASVLRMSIEP